VPRTIAPRRLERPGRQLQTVLAVAALVMIASVGVAAAKMSNSDVENGWEYKSKSAAGEEEGAVGLSFTVSRSGKSVSEFKIPKPPVHCEGLFEAVTGGSARIKKNGSFKATFKIMSSASEGKSVVAGKLIVTGKFAEHASEKGKLKSVFTASAVPKSCDATATYYTEAIE
jgi:hypothetical protein